MRGDPQIIALLNAQLKNELTAVNQYFLHARMLKNWGLTRLGEKVYKESLGEMKHADRIIERSTHAAVKAAIGRCEQAADYITRELFEAILDDTEEHIDWLETQLEL